MYSNRLYFVMIHWVEKPSSREHLESSGYDEMNCCTSAMCGKKERKK